MFIACYRDESELPDMSPTQPSLFFRPTRMEGRWKSEAGFDLERTWLWGLLSYLNSVENRSVMAHIGWFNRRTRRVSLANITQCLITTLPSSRTAEGMPRVIYRGKLQVAPICEIPLDSRATEVHRSHRQWEALLFRSCKKAWHDSGAEAAVHHREINKFHEQATVIADLFPKHFTSVTIG